MQQSPHARLFGVLPVGLLGSLGYTAILGAWAVQCFGSGRWAHRAGGAAERALAPATTAFLAELTTPMRLQVFVTPSCPYCPRAAVPRGGTGAPARGSVRVKVLP